MIGLDLWSGAGTLGLDGLLFLADIGLAAGSKMEVTNCIVFVETPSTNNELPIDQIIDPDLDDCLRIPHLDISFRTTNSHHIWLGFR